MKSSGLVSVALPLLWAGLVHADIEAEDKCKPKTTTTTVTEPPITVTVTPESTISSSTTSGGGPEFQSFICPITETVTQTDTETSTITETSTTTSIYPVLYTTTVTPPPVTVTDTLTFTKSAETITVTFTQEPPEPQVLISTVTDTFTVTEPVTADPVTITQPVTITEQGPEPAVKVTTITITEDFTVTIDHTVPLAITVTLTTTELETISHCPVPSSGGPEFQPFIPSTSSTAASTTSEAPVSGTPSSTPSETPSSTSPVTSPTPSEECDCEDYETQCGDDRYDLNTDANNCGACGNVCPGGAGTCINGVCAAACTVTTSLLGLIETESCSTYGSECVCATSKSGPKFCTTDIPDDSLCPLHKACTTDKECGEGAICWIDSGCEPETTAHCITVTDVCNNPALGIKKKLMVRGRAVF